MKPKNKGTALQEQNGVKIPSSAANIFPKHLFLPEDKITRVFSGGKNERIIDTKKIIIESKIRILIVQKIKKSNASEILDVVDIPRTL